MLKITLNTSYLFYSALTFSTIFSTIINCQSTEKNPLNISEQDLDELLEKTIEAAIPFAVENGSCLEKFQTFARGCMPSKTDKKTMLESTANQCCYSMITNACIKRSLLATDAQCRSTLYNHQKEYDKKIEQRCAVFNIKCAGTSVFFNNLSITVLVFILFLIFVLLKL